MMEAGSMDLLAWRKKLCRVRGHSIEPTNLTMKYDEDALMTSSVKSVLTVPSEKDDEEGFLPLTSQGLAMCLGE